MSDRKVASVVVVAMSALLLLAAGRCSGPASTDAGCAEGSIGCRCAAGEMCTSGTCCQGTCRDTMADSQYCGSCSSRCEAGGHAETSCVGGLCRVKSCAAGYLDCDRSASNGCEVNIDSDPSHCGACETRCQAFANQSASCRSGACQVSCDSGYLHCSANASDGCEVRADSDSENCGACGNKCSLATPICNRGACSATGCLAGGKVPPSACTRGVDSVFGTDWVVCAADCDSAWLSYGMPGGGRFQPLGICTSLGYSSWSGWDGSFNSICGTNERDTSCARPGQSSFTTPSSMPNKGREFGGVIGDTVEWRCVR